METFKVYIPKIGTWIDGNAFGGFYVDQDYQQRKIEEAKDKWKHNINSPKTMHSKMVKNEGDNYIKGELPIYIKYYIYKYNNDRVFLYAGDPKDYEYMDMMKIIADKRCLKNKSITRDYVLYTISVSKIPDNIEFFIDIHGRTKDFIYTKSSIP